MQITQKLVTKSFIIAVTTFFLVAFFSTMNALSADRFVDIKDPKGNLIGFNHLQINGKNYNIQFIYGTYADVYNQKSVPTFFNNEQGAEDAVSVINSALNSLNPTPQQIGLIPSRYASSKFSSPLNVYFVPCSIEHIVRYYGEKLAGESFQINSKSSMYNQVDKQWKPSLISGSTPNLPASYTRFKLVN